jgi:hemolysin III
MDFHDPVSSLSHLLMAGWSAFAAVVLLRLSRHHSRGRRLSVLLYSASAVALYAASGLFHGLQHPSPEARRAWQLLDQTAIFGLIFGSNLPLYAYLLLPRVRNRLVAMMAAVMAAGVAALWVSPWVLGHPPPHVWLVAAYLAMGVLGWLPIRTYYRRIGLRGVAWILALSVMYVGGAACEAARWPVVVPGVVSYHEVLHVFDMLGTAAHLVLLVRYVLPTADRPLPAASPAAHRHPSPINRFLPEP